MRSYIITELEHRTIARYLRTDGEGDSNIGQLVKRYQESEERIKADLSLLERLMQRYESAIGKGRTRPRLRVVGTTANRKL